MKKNGFTLVELSIVTIILGILAVSAIPISTSILRSARIQDTEQKLDIIESALQSYLIVNKRLPCPADLAAKTSLTIGDESGDGGGCDDSVDGVKKVVIPVSDPVTLVYGAVPTKALGLSDSVGSDGWGNKISYVVDENFVTDFPETDSEDAVIEVGFSSNFITTNAIYVLISHGENQNGAFPLYSDSEMGLGSFTEEQSNQFATFDETFVDYLYNENFDDHVRFKTKMQLIMDIDWQDVGCAETIVNTRTYTYANYGQIKTNTDYCLKCYKYSRWGEEYDCEPSCP